MTQAFMVSSVSTFSCAPFMAARLWPPALAAMTLLRPGRGWQDPDVGMREAESQLSGPGLGRGSLGTGSRYGTLYTTACWPHWKEQERLKAELGPLGPQGLPHPSGHSSAQGATGSG